MKRILLLVIISIVFGSANAQQLWNAVPSERLNHLEKTNRVSIPLKSQTFSLDLDAFKTILEAAPSRDNYTAPSTVIVPFPNGEGEIEHFRIYEASVLHPDLAAQHPNIKSYVGQGIEHPASSVRFSVTIFGLHSMMFSTAGTSYIDPYTRDLQNYLIYKKKDLQNPRQFFCGVTEDVHQNAERSQNQNAPLSVNASDGTLRTYRLAMACTTEYAQYQIGAYFLTAASLEEKKAGVLTAMNVTMTRVNGLYERDMAITMQIVPDNEDIIFVTSDNLANNNAGTLLGQIQSVINNAIGSSNYDIGHVVSTGDGGIASLGSVCSSVKAQGVTGSPVPAGDPFDIDYVAHEMGHQFNATHTFNNSFQRTAATAVEPGSGSTIMAYAGISAPNVQNNSDDHFHTVSIAQMSDFVNGSGGTCATETANGNSAPFVGFLSNYTIPKSTAFILKGSATDADGDALTYCWEQINANGSSSTINSEPSAFSTSGPNFRSLSPSDSPNRYMPQLNSVLAGNLTPTWEVVPAVGRTLNFALTVRDNQIPNGGQTGRDDISVVVVSAAGPFEVTSQNTGGITWAGNGSETITWDVAGTTGNGINTANVNILLSTDGGQNFDTILAENTPNDGSEAITVPNVNATTCRIMIEAAGNIYYAVNSNQFQISATNGTDDFGLQSFKLYPNPNNGSFSVAFNSDNTNDVSIAVHDIRGREIYSNDYENTGVFTANVNLQELQSGIYLVTVINGARKEMKKIIIE
ncbi:T9SS C-terminal target domain-containing protein [Flavobacterium arcticum]|uniref:T9SS C-terminal target domain-containing protein n=1 Tax=Flavobacterium arcticum TaxID=1784713 RepID=A0A345HAG5_9FLAO|nr:zinc-dependent metalloprotease family protein [Flavobacterium arcticum]AXG73575.1 T9SS C-terminal target domain-containing protein [Flavobacterium arcticum]KAF2513368.1 T9SS type A sorting domain-containing protein [Flavobacterium arcticum]